MRGEWDKTVLVMEGGRVGRDNNHHSQYWGKGEIESEPEQN